MCYLAVALMLPYIWLSFWKRNLSSVKKSVSKQLLRVKGHQIQTNVSINTQYTLRVLYNNSYTTLKLVCYSVDNLLLYPELKNNNARATHGFIQELIKLSLFSYLLIVYFQNKPSSGQTLSIPECVYWFLECGVPKWVLS